MNILREIRTRFQKAIEALPAEAAPYLDMIRPAQNAKHGDYQANFAMSLAARLGEDSLTIANRIVSSIDVSDFCEPPTVAGKGFINLRLRQDWIDVQTNQLLTSERFGVDLALNPHTFVVDYSGPNIAKPMHVGHLRSTVIGDAIYHILKFKGHTVIGDNHLGDWGTQFGMILYGYKNFLDEKKYKADPVAELSRLYRLVNQLVSYHQMDTELPSMYEDLNGKEGRLRDLKNAEAKGDKTASEAIKTLGVEIADLSDRIADYKRQLAKVDTNPDLKTIAEAHPRIASDARAETAALHDGDATNRRLWDEFLPHCLSALNAVYDRMGIKFDMMLGESFFQPKLQGIVDELLQQSIAKESDGAVCVFQEGNAAPFIIRKADGAFTYATTDLATIQYRLDDLDADVILYVVDARQAEHFDLLFGTTRRWKGSRAELRHIVFGSVLGNDKRPFKTREGGIVGLETLLDEAVARAREIVNKNDDSKPGGGELTSEEREQVAETVGVGGIKYADLKHKRESDYVFSWDKMLATNGDTATYAQYAYARICGIFRKAGAPVGEGKATISLGRKEERRLALRLNQYSEAIDNVCDDFRPNILTQYIFDLANDFSSFYNACPVLKEPDDAIKQSRLHLCNLTARVLRHGLTLLGISTSERM